MTSSWRHRWIKFIKISLKLENGIYFGFKSGLRSLFILKYVLKRIGIWYIWPLNIIGIEFKKSYPFHAQKSAYRSDAICPKLNHRNSWVWKMGGKNDLNYTVIQTSKKTAQLSLTHCVNFQRVIFFTLWFQMNKYGFLSIFKFSCEYFLFVDISSFYSASFRRWFPRDWNELSFHTKSYYERLRLCFSMEQRPIDSIVAL